MKLSCKQLDQAQRNPKEVAKMLLNPTLFWGGFNKVTYEVCYQLAKGLLSYNDAKHLLEDRLKEEFKDNSRNWKRRTECQKKLDSFYDFIQEEGIVCVQNFSHMRVELPGGNVIGGHGCSIFKDENGQSAGVIISSNEFDFSTTIRIPIEQYWITQKLKLDSETHVIIYVYNMADQSYQSISYPWDKIECMLEKANSVINRVELEIKNMTA